MKLSRLVAVLLMFTSTSVLALSGTLCHDLEGNRYYENTGNYLIEPLFELHINSLETCEPGHKGRVICTLNSVIKTPQAQTTTTSYCVLSKDGAVIFQLHAKNQAGMSVNAFGLDSEALDKMFKASYQKNPQDTPTHTWLHKQR